MKKESVCHLNRNKDKHHLDLFCYSSFSWHDFLFVSQSSILAFPVFCFFPRLRWEEVICGLLSHSSFWSDRHPVVFKLPENLPHLLNSNSEILAGSFLKQLQKPDTLEYSMSTFSRSLLQMWISVVLNILCVRIFWVFQNMCASVSSRTYWIRGPRDHTRLSVFYKSFLGDSERYPLSFRTTVMFYLTAVFFPKRYLASYRQYEVV